MVERWTSGARALHNGGQVLGGVVAPRVVETALFESKAP